MVISGHRVLFILCKMSDRFWGAAEVSVFFLYRTLFISRCLYPLPHLIFSTAQCGKLETLNRVSLQVCLRVPKFSGNLASLVEAVHSPLLLQVEAGVLRHTERVHAFIMKTTTRSPQQLPSRPHGLSDDEVQ